VSAIHQEDIEALEILKASHEIFVTSLQTDLGNLQERYRVARTDLEQQKQQLLDSLLTNANLQKDIARNFGRPSPEAEPPVIAGSGKSPLDSLEEVSRSQFLQSSPEPLQFLTHESLSPKHPEKSFWGRLSFFELQHNAAVISSPSSLYKELSLAQPSTLPYNIASTPIRVPSVPKAAKKAYRRI